MAVKSGAPGTQTTQPTIRYTNEAADRLTRISQDLGAANGNVAQTITLAYDAAGRRTRVGGSQAHVSLPAADNPDAQYAANGNLLADGTHRTLVLLCHEIQGIMQAS